MPELEIIRSLGDEPAENDAVHVTRARRRAWAELNAMIEQTHQRSQRTKRLFGLAAAVSLVFLVVGPLSLRGSKTSTAAAAVLNRLATVAESQPFQALTPGDYVFTKSQLYDTVQRQDLSSGEQWSVAIRTERETWMAPDGSGRIVETIHDVRFLSDADRKAWQRAGSPDLYPTGRLSDERFEPGELTFLDLAALPTDLQSLTSLIEERRILPGPPGACESFDIIGDLLRETHAHPKLRAALYRVAAGLRGVHVEGTVRDAVGRSGIGLSCVLGGVRTELIFDPATSMMLEERTIDTMSQGTLAVATFLESGTVRSISGRP
jgi:hypothetical protein